jgi:capsular polysaccharide export protein
MDARRSHGNTSAGGLGRQRRPLDLPILFPEAFGLGAWTGEGPGSDLIIKAGPRQVARVHRRGLLTGPDFSGRPRWLSAAPRLDRDRDQVAARAAGDRGARLIAEIRRLRVGGSFWRRGDAPGLPGCRLVILPAAPDHAIRLVETTCAMGPAGDIVVVGQTADPAAAARFGCRFVRGPVDLWPHLDDASEVHVWGDDPAGCLGLASGLALVRHFPGLPPKRIDPTEAAADATISLIDETRYVDPFTNRPASGERILEILGDWRRVIERNRLIGCVAGIGRWKRRAVAGLLHDGDHAPAFEDDPGIAVRVAGTAGRGIAAWPSTIPPGLVEASRADGIPVFQVEDGFLRSIGLGVDAVPPCSVVVDDLGIYFDPARPSRLEQILEQTIFDPPLVARARRLREALIAARLTKYNTGERGPASIAPPNRRRILVPGQVADDLSVRLGGGTIRGNLELVARVREENPMAFILYKPHPDVDAGHRLGAVPDREVLRHADRILRAVAIPSLLAEIDEVHTLTSLAGFEALLRGHRVVTHGQPFYAGWGLTEDRVALPRRTRRLDLDELVAGALILYPHYLDPVTGLPCPVEVLVDRLADPTHWRPGALVRFRRLFGHVRRHLGLKRPALPEQR